jgi:hypothetical protein
MDHHPSELRGTGAERHDVHHFDLLLARRRFLRIDCGLVGTLG